MNDDEDAKSCSSSDSFEDIEDVLARHSQKTPSLYSLSQNVRASQLPPTSSTTTQGSRGVAQKKTRAQMEMESQHRAEVASKQAKAESKRAAEEKKVAKTMKARKEDVSQLVDGLSEFES